MREKAEVIQVVVFMNGVNTLLQSFVGTRLPAFINRSSSYTMILFLLTRSDKYTSIADPNERFMELMRSFQGALVVASIFQMLLSFLGIWRLILRLLCPLSTFPLVTLVALGFYNTVFPKLAECAVVGFPGLAILICISQSTGTYILVSRYGGAPPIPPYALSRGIGWQGVGLCLDALFGTIAGSTASSVNVGQLFMTRAGNSRVIRVAALMMICFAVFGKFNALFAAIPLSAFAPFSCILYGCQGLATSDALEEILFWPLLCLWECRYLLTFFQKVTLKYILLILIL